MANGTNVAERIASIAASKSAIAAAIAAKGVTVPTGTQLDGMANLIAAIPTGGGSGDGALGIRFAEVYFAHSNPGVKDPRLAFLMDLPKNEDGILEDLTVTLVCYGVNGVSFDENVPAVPFNSETAGTGIELVTYPPAVGFREIVLVTIWKEATGEVLVSGIWTAPSS